MTSGQESRTLATDDLQGGQSAIGMLFHLRRRGHKLLRDIAVDGRNSAYQSVASCYIYAYI